MNYSGLSEHQLLQELVKRADTEVTLLTAISNTQTKILKVLSSPTTSEATGLLLTITGGTKPMSTFTVDTTDGTANLQFVDDKGDAVAGPNDSVTGSPLVPTVTTDTPTVLTAGTDAPASSGAAGAWSAPLTVVAEGVANVSVEALTNSDGSPAVDAQGNPYALPASVEVTVTAGGPTGLTMTVTG